MSREILFRGKMGKGDWIYGCYVLTPDDGPVIMTCADWGGKFSHPVIPATVGQYTGLCDKNGVKIFEGDILTTDLIRPYVIVVFRDGSFMFNCNDGDKDYYDIMLPIMKNVQTQTLYHKVIGNIHDNPELVKEEESK